MQELSRNTLPLSSPKIDGTLNRHRRVVAVQGAVQLVSALAAMRVSDRGRATDASENHLIVHDLSAPGDQGELFAACLKSLAQQASQWKSIRYLPLSEMLRFQESLKIGSWERATETMHDAMGFDRCDEILFGQNLLFINNLLSRSYASAEKACYGDGIGLNFTADYYSPGIEHPGGLRMLERWLRTRLRALRGKPIAEAAVSMKSKKHAVAFHRHYLLLANQFDEQLPHFEQLEELDFKQMFGLFAESLPRLAGKTCAIIEAELARADQVIVLLTSNFSETKRMTLKGEVACCLNSVNRKQNKPNALLVIKPHPRDSQEKIAAIEKVARKSFRNVVTLADPWTFFVPFESVFDRYFASNPRVQQMTSVVCSSSACVSLELLYGQPCELGFGARNVRRHFAPKWQELRVRHEADLNRLVQRIRKSTIRRVAA